MSTSNGTTLLRHPLEHPAEAMCAVGVGIAGQLLLGWVLARAARSAERDDPTSGWTGAELGPTSPGRATAAPAPKRTATARRPASVVR